MEEGGREEGGREEGRKEDERSGELIRRNLILKG